jgi:hypothetical protein
MSKTPDATKDLALDPVVFASAMAAIDAANARDPKSERHDGEELPAALLYGRRMSCWLKRLYPEASTALQLAVRCQHIERWTQPRKDYPEGRIGYLTWRRDLKDFHARRAGEILAQVGCPEAVIARVQSLVRKERIKRDAEAQALEDTACLVFLAHEFAAFAATQDRDKIKSILQKTWRKMSDRGHEAALALPLDESAKALVIEALTPA